MEGLTETQATGLFAIIGAMAVGAVVISIIWYVLQVIARWKIFTKAGEKGWKAIIPVYNEYVMYKISWKTLWFWISLGALIVYSIFSSLYQNTGNGFLYFIALVFIIACAVISIIQLHKLSKSFGHGVGFTVGLVLLNPIFMLILAFDSSKYIGAQE